jgi:hypothetical protein
MRRFCSAADMGAMVRMGMRKRTGITLAVFAVKTLTAVTVLLAWCATLLTRCKTKDIVYKGEHWRIAVRWRLAIHSVTAPTNWMQKRATRTELVMKKQYPD